jgi:hypothetical protein
MGKGLIGRRNKYNNYDCSSPCAKRTGTNWGSLVDEKCSGKLVTNAAVVNYQIISGNNNTFIYNKGCNEQIYEQ